MVVIYPRQRFYLRKLADEVTRLTFFGGLIFGLALLNLMSQPAAPLGPGILQFSDGGIVRGPTDSKKLALVFTGHTFAEGSQVILDELSRHQAKASFFLTGDFIANPNFQSVVKRIVREGHYLGPHSDKHLLYCSWETPAKLLVRRNEFEADLHNNLKKIETLGLTRTSIKYFLPPYEHYDHKIVEWSEALGLAVVNYTPGTRANADYTVEAEKNFVSSKAIFDSIVKKESTDPNGLNGFILLLHIGAGPERQDKFFDRFGDLLDFLKAHSYELVSIDGLLNNNKTNP